MDNSYNRNRPECGRHYEGGVITGMTLYELRDDYIDRIFNQYLPFWEKGGIDRERGGFICELNDDGSVQYDEKNIWYQGRGIWVYSYLYNHFGIDPSYLEIAVKARDFMVEFMYLGNGKWHEAVDRNGKPVASSVGQGSGKDTYGALFAAAGLIELFKATGNEADLELAKTSIRQSVTRYENPDYKGVSVPGIENAGLRALGHSFMFVWLLTNLLSSHKDPFLEDLQEEHVNHIMNDYWNPEYGIVNEYLFHDYSRIPGFEQVMSPGHSLEALWMVFAEGMRKADKLLMDFSKNRIRSLIEINWDYVFGGFCSEEFNVFGTVSKCAGPYYELKSMWAQTELLVASMMVFENTGEEWAREWYERGRDYCLKTMANTGNGIWRQAVDRRGNDKKRPGISIYRKDNFHQIRCLMMNLQAIERIIEKSKNSLNK